MSVGINTVNRIGYEQINPLLKGSGFDCRPFTVNGAAPGSFETYLFSPPWVMHGKLLHRRIRQILLYLYERKPIRALLKPF